MSGWKLCGCGTLRANKKYYGALSRPIRYVGDMITIDQLAALGYATRGTALVAKYIAAGCMEVYHTTRNDPGDVIGYLQ